MKRIFSSFQSIWKLAEHQDKSNWFPASEISEDQQKQEPRTTRVATFFACIHSHTRAQYDNNDHHNVFGVCVIYHTYTPGCDFNVPSPHSITFLFLPYLWSTKILKEKKKTRKTDMSSWNMRHF